MNFEQLMDAYKKLSAFNDGDSVDPDTLTEFAAIVRSSGDNVEVAGVGNGLLGDCLFQIAQSPTLLAAALCQWLTNDADASLGKVLVHQASVSHLDSIRLQNYNLRNFAEQQAVLVGYRLCALMASPAISLGWVLSLSRDFQQSAYVSEAIGPLLAYHYEEIPESSRMLLREPSASTGIDAAVALLDVLDQDGVELNELPHLRELEMDSEMRSMFSSLKRAEHREIYRRSNEMSVFAQIVTQHRLKYATRTSIEVVGGDGMRDAPIAMSLHSISLEFPMTEVADPELSRLRRNRLWRGEQK